MDLVKKVLVIKFFSKQKLMFIQNGQEINALLICFLSKLWNLPENAVGFSSFLKVENGLPIVSFACGNGLIMNYKYCFVIFNQQLTTHLPDQIVVFLYFKYILWTIQQKCFAMTR